MHLLLAIFQLLVSHAPILAGFVLPPVVDYLNKDVPKPTEKALVTFLVCFAVAALENWNKILYGSSDEVFSSFSIIFLESQVIYKLYFKNSPLRATLLSRIKPSANETSTPE